MTKAGITFLLGLLASAVPAAPGTALAAFPPDPGRVQPADGGHWQARLGLPDSRGNARQALVRWVDGSDGHPEVAAVKGLDGEDTSTIDELGFAVAGDEAGIIPCVRVAYTDALGDAQELMLTPGRFLRGRPGREPGWTAYALEAGLPPGGTITAVDVGVHVETSSPDPVRVRFDDVVVNDQVFTHPSDRG